MKVHMMLEKGLQDIYGVLGRQSGSWKVQDPGKSWAAQDLE